MPTQIYECPDCGKRVMGDYSQELPPSLWCSCDGFNLMDKVLKEGDE